MEPREEVTFNHPKREFSVDLGRDGLNQTIAQI